MNAKFEKYLNTVDKHLKPLPISERADIIKEIKGSVIEMESDGLSEEHIFERLGDPKDLAKAYLGDLLAESSGLSKNRFLIICAFYGIVGFSGMIVIPCLAIIAPVFIVCGVASVILAAVRLIDYIFSLNLPYVEYIGIFSDGTTEVNPVLGFAVCLVIGVLLYAGGRFSWKMLIAYCKKVSETKKDLSV